jgi:hypothetical protein
LILAAVFAVAAVAKLLDRDGARQAVRSFGVPEALAPPVAGVLPILELAVAVALVDTTSAVVGAAAAAVLLALFMAGIAVTLARGRQPDCHCFGALHTAAVGRRTLVRDGVLLAAAVVVAAAGPGAGLLAWAGGISALDWITIIVAVVFVIAFIGEGSLLVDKWRHRSTRP